MANLSSGFTLIEIIVVIVIIGILASLVAVGITAAMSTSKISMTEAMLGTISGALENYRTKWGDYPPSSLDEIKGRVPNDTNNGIESLVACLSSRKNGTLLYQPGDDFYGNTDKDRADRNVTDWFFGDNSLREYRDIFGFTIVYIHHKDYARPKAQHLKYKFTDGGPEAAITIEKSATTGTYSRPDTYQLRSVGKDGKFGTNDDIRVP